MAWYNNDFWDEKPKKQRKKAAEPELETENLEPEVKEQPTEPEPEPEVTPKTKPETPKTTPETTPNKEGADFLHQPKPMPEVLVKKRKIKAKIENTKPQITLDVLLQSGIEKTEKE